MTREEAKQYIKEQLPSFLQPAKRVSGKQTYICPKCGSGSGKNGTGISPYRKNGTTRYKCFACDLNEDIIGLWKTDKGIEDDKEAFQGLYQYYGITIDQTEGTTMENRKPAADPGASTTAAQDQKPQEAPASDPGQTPPDYVNFFLQANKDIEKTDYHRGISLETLNRYKVGYVEAWKHPKAPNAPASPRLIIPVSRYTYIARDTRANLTEEQGAYKKQKVKCLEEVKPGAWIFNKKAIEEATSPIVVVEGELDALSIIDAGGQAVGLGSIANVGAFLEYLKDHKPAQPLVISLDNEDTPQVQAAVEKLEDGLTAQGITFYRHNIAGQYKDANDYLQADREAFTREVQTVKELPGKEYRKEQSVAGFIKEFIDGIADSVNTPPISTGFKELDNKMDGGLFEGLYVLGADTGTGKTAFLMQIMDNIAASGHDVIVFALEMGKAELMARSISRHTIIECIQSGTDTRNAKTSRGITDFNRYGKYSNAEKELIGHAIKAYSEYAGHIFIYEGIGDIGTAKVRGIIENHISITGNTPVVLVDYLQLLAPANERATDKQNIDKNVLELKRISRDCKIPLIAVSSLNREGYKKPRPVSMTDFKESGAIEYTVNMLLGFQFQDVGTEGFSKAKASGENPRKMKITCLKSRSSAAYWGVCFDYYHLFNYFVENGKIGWEDEI